MSTSAQAEVNRTASWVCFPALTARKVVIAFAGLTVLQSLIFLLLGTGRSGHGISALILVVDNLLAIACACSAFRRAHNVTSLFWLLYALSLGLILIPTAIGAVDILFNRSTLSPSTWRVLFCLYGAPILMVLSLPETDRERTRPEIVLDLMQVLLVAGLVFGAFFLVPVLRLLPSEALLRYVNLSNLQSLFLLGAVGARILVARFDRTRNMVIRVGVFVFSCAIVTFIGSWIDLHQSAKVAAWFDLGWALPLAVGGFVALGWSSPTVDTSDSTAPRLMHYLATNLTMVSVLCICVAILMGPWKVVHSEFFIAVAVGVSLLAFVVRLSLTQHQQQVQIAQRKQIEKTLLFKNALLEGQAETTLDGILVVDQSEHIVLANKQFGLLFGIPDELLRTKDDHIVLEHLIVKVHDPDKFAKRVKYLYSHRDERSRDEFRLENGKVFDRYSAPLVDSTGVYRGRVWYFRDITEHKLAAERVQYLAYYDGLTGLPNRTLFRDHLTKVLAGARRQKGKIAVLFLDLDGFKNINDSLGHSIGDLLLQEVAQRLKKWGREQDTIARFGGDEFLILLTDVRKVYDTAAAVERLMDTMTAEFLVREHSINISCSVGISIFPEHGVDGETLISNADTAMYSAKASGRHTFRYFTKDMNAELVERMSLESRLRLALERNEFFLVYQPQMDIATGRISGLEALLRWQHPTLGLVPPDKFIPIAESSGLILPIGEWVLSTVCRQARQWQDEGVPPLSVAVNISAVQFRQENFCALIRRVLNESDLSPRYLELELTESILLENADVMLSVVRELNAMGLGIAIDDFGTGYSSFSYLRQFRAHRLKIDRSLIRDVASKSDDAAIATAIISMGKSLNLKVIAEGVEDEAQLSFLRDHQCDEIQGYYVSKPLTADKVVDKIRDGLGAHCVQHLEETVSLVQTVHSLNAELSIRISDACVLPSRSPTRVK